MQPQLFTYVNLLLSAAVFFDLLFTVRKNTILKTCFISIVISLFAMNYFACAGISTRFEVVLAKTMRIIYVASSMLVIIHLVKPKMPSWIICLIIGSAILGIGSRILYYDQIDIENLSKLPNQVFSTGPEFYVPKPFLRSIILVLSITTIVITFWYYRLFLGRIDRESPYYGQLLPWAISFVLPFFLLVIFAVLGVFDLFTPAVSHYLFSLFSCMIIFSIQLRPRVLNTTLYADIGGYNTNIQAGA